MNECHDNSRRAENIEDEFNFYYGCIKDKLCYEEISFRQYGNKENFEVDANKNPYPYDFRAKIDTR